MGGGSSTRRVTFEADENENITVVKGVRVRAGTPLGLPSGDTGGLVRPRLPRAGPGPLLAFFFIFCPRRPVLSRSLSSVSIPSPAGTYAPLPL